MLFVSKEVLAGVGEMIAAADAVDVKVELTENALTVSFSKSGEPDSAASKPATARDARPKKKGKPKTPVFYEGKDTAYWAGKLGLTRSGVLYSISKYGNPYGAPGPIDRDKVMAATVDVDAAAGEAGVASDE